MLSFIDVIPTKETVSRTESLNILCGVVNDADEITTDIRVWGKNNQEWRALVTQKTFIRSQEHKHLYFTLTSEMFSPEYWGEEVEEIEICVSDRKPKSYARGILIFIE